MTDTTAIVTRDLSKRYENGVDGLIDLDLKMEQGEIFEFLGPNGSGKTTTVRLLNGTLSPTGGDARVLGYPVGNESLRLKTATLAELAQMYEAMTVQEDLMFFAAMYDIPPSEVRSRIRDLLTKMELWSKKELKLGSFSTGMRKRVHLARVLLHRPEIVLTVTMVIFAIASIVFNYRRDRIKVADTYGLH